MAAMFARLEGSNAHVINVDTSVHPSRVTPKTNLRDLARWDASGGRTDMAAPFSWALDQRLGVAGLNASPQKIISGFVR